MPAPVTNQLLTKTIMVNSGLIAGKKTLTADQFFDLSHAVYASSFGGDLTRVLFPMLNLSDAKLASEMRTSDGVPAMLLGDQFAFDSGPAMLVLTWKDNSAQKPSALRVYALASGAPQSSVR